MARFRVEVPVAAPVSRVWARLTDWPAHARLAPFTSIRVIGPGDRPGSAFVARTGLGPLAFDDPMQIELFEPPSGETGTGRFRVVKTGRLLRGQVEAEVGPGEAGSLLVWHEELRVPPEALTRFAGPLIGVVAGAAYGAALRRMGREVEREMGGRG